MLLKADSLQIVNLQKSITRAQAKAVHKDLPPGGVWRTIRGNHVYIVNGQIVAGAGVGKSGKPIKLTKQQLAEHQSELDKEAKKSKKKVSEAKGTKTKQATKQAKTKQKASEAKETKKEQSAKSSGTKSGSKTASEGVKATKKPKSVTGNAKEQMAKNRKDIDAIVNSSNNHKANKKARETTKEDIEAFGSNPKVKQGKGATKADLDAMLASNPPKKKAKETTREDLDAMLGETPKKAAKEVPKEDLTKLSTSELQKRVNALENQYKKEAEELYGARMQELKQKERELSLQGGEVMKWRKSKKRDAEMARIEKERGQVLSEQSQLFQKQQEHIAKYRDSDVAKELRRRNEIFNRQRTGALLPEEEQELAQQIGAKPFDPKAPKEKFYKFNNMNGWAQRAIAATPVDLGHGLDGFVTHDEKGSEYSVYVAKTGERVTTHYPQGDESKLGHEEHMRRVVNQARLKINAMVNGDEFRQGIGKEALHKRLNEIIQDRGISPRYHEDGTVRSGMDKLSSSEPHLHTFHKYLREGGFTEAQGAKVKIHPELTTFHSIDEKSGLHTIIEARTGLSLGSGKSKAEAVEKAKAGVEQNGIDKVKQLLDKYANLYGESPSWAQYNKGDKIEKSLSEVRDVILGWQMGV